MDSNLLRKKFLDFFEKNGHTVVPSSSLIPDDPSVLLTTAGMQQFKKYYTGEADPMKTIHQSIGKPLGSKNAASVQKSFRTSDIDEVGDESHLTFFEMLGNFSFGGYFKEEAIRYAHEFITKELGLKIDYVSVFGGEGEVPVDTESEKIWNGIDPNLEIKRLGRADNFWGPTGKEGPCGPTTEIYINGVEIWNIVFNEYYCRKLEVGSEKLEKLKTPGVDTGMGLERLVMVVQGKKNIFETDLFEPIIKQLSVLISERKQRVIADHLRASVFLLADGLHPSNKDAGYVLRRLLRRLYLLENTYVLDRLVVDKIIVSLIEQYGSFYGELKEKQKIISLGFKEEREKFEKTLDLGRKELTRFLREKGSAFRTPHTIGKEYGTKDLAEKCFDLYQSYGFPVEVTIEELLKEEHGMSIDVAAVRGAFDDIFKKHQELSRASATAKFGGHGLLLDTGELKAANEEELKIVTRLHTATHLLQAALRKVLGPEVHQQGSDITVERTRFDFTFPRKLTSEELAKIEGLVNEAVQKDLTMEYKEMPYEEAVKTGALYFVREKYPPRVKVYTAYDQKTGEVFSRELCGGPHVSHTGEVGHFKILKEESSSAGVRRIRAVVDV